jgi:two-component system LytT family sensor kinase
VKALHQQNLPAMKDQTRAEARRWWAKVALALIFWTGVGLLFLIQSYLLTPNRVDLISAIKSTMPRWYIWGLLAPIVFAVNRRLFGRLPLSRKILANVPLGVLVIFVVAAVDYTVLKVLGVEWLPDSAARFFLQVFPGYALVYAAIAGAGMVISYAGEARRREQEAAELAIHSARLEANLAAARLGALQSQLNPHFLFNTFNTISAFTETDPKTARRMMARLGALLRFSLDHAGRQEVTLAEELRFLEDYLAIERLRFEGRLTVDVQIEDGVGEALVPSFVLQPLVENAVRHGTGAVLRDGHVQVCARRTGDLLKIGVEDDGVGLPAGWRLEDHAGVGLSNITRRLEQLYGPEHTFDVRSRREGGVCVEITLPFRREAQPAAPRPSDVVEVA